MNLIKNFLKGVAISISQIVPGVSGGTIAMILGVYDKLLHAVNNIVKDFKNQYKILLQVGIGAIFGIFLFSNIVKTLFDNYPIPIAIGGIVGTLLTARIIEMLLNKFPEQTYILIFGFILGSVFSVFPGVDGISSFIGIILGVIGFIFTYYISRNE